MGRVNVSLRKQSFYIHYADDENTKIMDNPHLHNDFEIYYLVEGEREYYISGKRHLIGANQLVFIDRNVLHQTRKVPGTPHKRYVVNFHNDFLGEDETYLLHDLFNKGYTIILPPPEKATQIKEFMWQMMEEYSNSCKSHQLYIKTLLIQLLITSRRMIENTSEIQRKNDAEHHVSELLKNIHKNFHLNLSLQKLSDTFHLNEHYISRIFKRTTGYGFSEYVNVLRISEAERLLKETDLPIYQIAVRVGYSTQVHFNRVFRRRTGRTPSQYRQQL